MSSELSSEPDGEPKRKRAGRVARLSLDAISDAVIELGFNNASLTAVASQLSVAHGALYRYIGDRDGMILAALDRVAGSWDWPELDDDWQNVIWNEAIAWWKLCSQHPGFVTGLLSVPMVPTSIGLRSMAVAKHLADLGMSTADALVITDFVLGMVHETFQRLDQRAAVIEHALSLPAETRDAYLAGASPEMAQILASALVDDPWPWFTRRLDMVIAGAAARFGTMPDPSTRRPV